MDARMVFGVGDVRGLVAGMCMERSGGTIVERQLWKMRSR